MSLCKKATPFIVSILILASCCSFNEGIDGPLNAPYACSVDENQSFCDPLEPINRFIFAFNNIVDDFLITPIVMFYESVFPECVRGCIQNVLKNFVEPAYCINALLRFEGTKSATHFVRFLMNSSFGIGGLFDVSGDCELKADPEDLGKTFQWCGFPPGMFVMLPILGPSCTRDGIGRLLDFAVNPVDWFLWRYYPAGFFVEKGVDYVDVRSRYRAATEMLREEFDDPYVVMRNAYFEKRGDVRVEPTPEVDTGGSTEKKSVHSESVLVPKVVSSKKGKGS